MNLSRHIRSVAFSVSFIALSLASVQSVAQVRGIRRGPIAQRTLMRYAGNYHQFNDFYQQEKVYLQFDNTSYYQGETIWFKAYVVKAKDHSRAASRVLYVELLTADGTLVRRQKVKVTAGQADGKIDLVESNSELTETIRGQSLLESGFYEIRAYTMYMLNFPEKNIFSRIIPVFKRPEDPQKPLISSTELSPYQQARKQRRIRTKPLDELNISFYPEGGNIIIGRDCRVAFKAVGADGMGVHVEGTVNDTLDFSTLHDGMGEFRITPTGTTNRVSVNYKGKDYTFRLPAAEKEGYSVRLTQEQGDNLLVTCIRPQSGKSGMLGLVLCCRGEIYDYREISEKLEAAVSYVTFPLDNVPEGVCQVLMYDTDGKALSSRMFYHKGNRITPEISITTDKSYYHPFEKIGIDIDLTYNGEPFRDRICLSVRDRNSFVTVYQNDLRTDLLLTSDLKGYIHKPEYYFEQDDSIHDKALDLLMLVQGWERYDWKIMTGQTKFSEVHRLEDSLSVNGWVLSPFLDIKLDGMGVVGIVEHPEWDGVELFSTNSAQGGYFGFNVSDFNGEADLRLWTNGAPWARINGTDLKILLERSIRPKPRKISVEESLIPETTDWSSDYAHSGIRVYTLSQIEDLGNDDDDEDANLSWTRIGDSYILPDVVIKEKRMFVDYDTFKEYDIQADTDEMLDNAGFTTDIFGYLIDKTGRTYDFDETVFLVHCKDLNILKATDVTHLDMENIQNIYVFDELLQFDEIMKIHEVIHKTLREQDSTYNTMVASFEHGRKTRRYFHLIDITLKDPGELKDSYELMDISKRQTTLQGFTAPSAFYSPQYPSGAVPGDVDHRRTLYWDPNIITDEQGHAHVEFYNNSYTQDFHVTGAGITASGTPYVLDTDF